MKIIEDPTEKEKKSGNEEVTETPTGLFDEIFEGNGESTRRMFEQISRRTFRTNTMRMLLFVQIGSNAKSPL